MGHTVKQLAKRDIPSKSIFHNRFVTEICENIHVHYRNLRISLSLDDFMQVCKGFVESYNRWGKMGFPQPGKGIHIELCRKKVATSAFNDGIQVNLNDNLYKRNDGKIYSEGSVLEDDRYIHIKVRDQRWEFTIKEFEELSNAISEAKARLEDCHTNSCV